MQHYYSSKKTWVHVSDRIRSYPIVSNPYPKVLMDAGKSLYPLRIKCLLACIQLHPHVSSYPRVCIVFVSCLYRACIVHVSKHTFVQDTTQLCTGNDTFPIIRTPEQLCACEVLKRFRMYVMRFTLGFLRTQCVLGQISHARFLMLRVLNARN